MTSPERSEITAGNGHENGRHQNGHHHALQKEEAAVVERIRRRARARRMYVARSLVARMQIGPDGSRRFLRFTTAQRWEHQLLIVTFTILTITGLLQRYSTVPVVVWIINSLFGGVETLRTLHHLAAAAFILEAVYHAIVILLVWFVNREAGAMWPRRKDLLDLLQTIKFNLSLSPKKPQHDRYSVEEKIEYWALLWGSIVMILTGLIQWFPAQVTLLFPGQVVPVSRAIHGWEALLAALSILVWHMYHTVIKERNTSIFTGYMSEEEMRETHPLEYRRIVAAHDYLQSLEEEKPHQQEAAEGRVVVGDKQEPGTTT